MKDFFKNKCNIVRDILPLYADDSCSRQTREQIGIHLITCKECREYYKEIKSYHEKVSEDVIPPSDKQFGEVMNRLRRRKIVRRSFVTASIITSLAINAVLLLNDN